MSHTSSNPKRPHLLRDEQGMALAMTIVLLLALGAIGMMAVVIGGTDLTVAGNQRRHSATLDVAEAGVAEAMHRMSMTAGTMIDVGGTQIDGSISDPADPPDINWETRIYQGAPGAIPASAGSQFTTASAQVGTDVLEYSHPSDPERALVIRHKVDDIDNDGFDDIVLYDPTKIPPENAASGEPVEVITATGRNGNARRTVEVEVIRFPIAPNVVAALASDGGVDLRGNVTVCGHDHRVVTPIGVQLPACSPAWDEVTGHLPAVMTTGDPVGRLGSTDLLGTPTMIDTLSTNIFYSLDQALGITMADLQDILSDADHTADNEAGPYRGITYIQGNARFNGINGEGLLYVTGDLTTTGNFSWKGLVYVEGDLANTGNTWVLGAVMVRGRSSTAVDFGAGTPVILYSRAMLSLALNSAMRYVVLSWRER